MKFIWRNPHVFEDGGWKLNEDDEMICKRIIDFIQVIDETGIEHCRNELSDISVDIAEMITWNTEHRVPVVLRLREEDSRSVFEGLNVSIKVPVDKLRDLIEMKYGAGFVAHIPSTILIERADEPIMYKHACNVISGKLNVYNIFDPVSGSQDDNDIINYTEIDNYTVGKRFIDSKMNQIENDKYTKPKVNWVIHTDDDSKVESFYDSSTTTLHVYYDGQNKTEAYKYSVYKAIKEHTMIRVPAKVITDSGEVIDTLYECGVPNSRNSRELPYGIAFKCIQKYSRNIEHNNIFLKNGSNYISTEPFTLYAVGFVPYSIMSVLASVAKKVYGKDTSNKDVKSSFDTAPTTLKRYGGEINVGDKRLKYSPAYEDLDIYDQYDIDHYTDPNELLEKHYNFGELLYGDSSDYDDDELISLNEWLVKYGGI